LGAPLFRFKEKNVSRGRRKTQMLKPVTRELLEKVAGVMGPSSAAAAALADADNHGGTVNFYLNENNSYVTEKIGPPKKKKLIPAGRSVLRSDLVGTAHDPTFMAMQNLSATVTGRLSSKDVNLSNAPKSKPRWVSKGMLLTEFIKQFGPLVPITNEESWALYKEGEWKHLFAITSTDVGYEDLSEDDRPSDEELKDRGETKEEYSQSMSEGIVGHHIVNVERRYKTEKEITLGADAIVEVDDFGALPDA
jgi:hypothetical protein